jgi:4-diphosphocytidyl-2-C-methyl-D-erythritol kinase
MNLDNGWPAPAKLNLFLHVLGRRADGYHELQTGFQFLDWGDRLHFELDDDTAITRVGWRDVPPDQDLVVRAAALLRERAGIGEGVTIHLTKSLPVGGGLGGGSSDAATTLVAMNRLWDAGLGIDELCALGLELGADVPVFVRGRAALAEGVGERLKAVDWPEAWYLVVDPGVSVSTRAVFEAPELTRNSAPTTIAGLLAHGGRNDCEPVVRRRYPEVGRALDWLGEHGPARMTGTGGCLFASFETREQAESVRRNVPAPWRARAARGLNRSPLLDRLDEDK